MDTATPAPFFTRIRSTLRHLWSLTATAPVLNPAYLTANRMSLLTLPFLQVPDVLQEGLQSVVFEQGSKYQMLRPSNFKDAGVASSLRITTKGRARNRYPERIGHRH
jgi:hypothetical protein